MKVIHLMTMLQKTDPMAEITIDHNLDGYTIALTGLNTSQTTGEGGITTTVDLVLDVEAIVPDP